MAISTTAISRQTAARRDPYQSPYFLGLTLLLLLFLAFIHNGYKCFRTDHLTQIPLLYKMYDPSLFPRDWFMITNAHFELRRFHLLLLEMCDKTVGLPLGILLSYSAIILGSFAAWVAIARRMFGRASVGFAAIFMLIMIGDGEIGSNHVIEDMLIPRMEAYLFAWWSLYVMLGKGAPRDWMRGLVAGVLIGAGGYFHPAIGIEFGLAIVIWLLLDPERRDWAKAGTFLAGMTLQFIPLIHAADRMLEKSTLTAAEQIQLAAYIRHPHHMIPHFWHQPWALFVGVIAVFTAVWLARRKTCEGTRILGRFVWVMIGMLAVSTIFIEIVPVKSVIVAQPYRLAVMLYAMMMLVLGRYAVDLVASGDYRLRVRAMLLALGLQGWPLMLPAAALELFFMHRDRRGLPPLKFKFFLGLVMAACLIASIFEHDFEKTVLWIVLVPALIALAERLRFPSRPKLVYGGMAGAAALGIFAISSFFWLPVERWIGSDTSKLRNDWARWAYKWQFKPIPIVALERLGAWAGQHTEPNALFIIPPLRQPEGFRIWSKRSVWFNIKFFPYKASGFEEWRNRYLAIGGLPDVNDKLHAAAVHDALNDVGGSHTMLRFMALTPRQIVELARRITASPHEGPGPIYIATPTRYNDPALELLYSDADRQRNKLDRNRHYLYRIHLK